jgi:hypothetical protein
MDDELGSELDEDELTAAWEAVDRQAAEVLELACAEVLSEDMPTAVVRAATELRAGVAAGTWPFDYIRNACGWHDGAPAEDIELWLRAAASVIAPEDDPQIDVEELAGVGGLEHADWLALVVGLVRRGLGARLDAESWFADLSTLPEIEGEAPDDLEAYYGPVVETIAPLLQAIGALDSDRRLTAVGRWGLPQVLLLVWGGEDHVPQLTDEEAAIAMEILAERSRSLEELRVELARRGIFADADRLVDSLQWRTEVYGFDDGVWAFLPQLVQGAVLTHRLTAEEKDREVVDTPMDLGLWEFLTMDGFPLAGGGEVKAHFAHRRLAQSGISGIAGPPGWLGEFVAGELVGFRYAGDALALEKADDAPPLHDDRWRAELVDLARRLARASAERPELDYELPAVSTLDLALALLREQPGALADVHAPWSELLADSGLEIHHGHLGVPGTAWQTEPAWLEDDEREVYRAWLALLSADRLGQTPSSVELTALAAGLQGVVVDLAATDLVNEREREPLVVQMVEASTGAAAAGPLYLRARVAEAAGDSLAMRDLLERAVAADPSYEDALADLAELQAIAGDAREAARLYSLADVDSHAPEVHVLRPFLAPPTGGPGRNQPCPCGSGKKYKLCHGRTDLHPLVDRGGWLLAKLKTFLQRSVNRGVLFEWALESRGEAGDDEVWQEAMEEPLTWDLAVFDGGVLGAFQRLYGPLLPEDEAELVEQWAQSTRRLLEVTTVRESIGISCRDVLTGEEFDVADRLLSQELGPNHLLFGRLVDQGDGRPRFWDDPVGIPTALRTSFAELLRSDPTAAQIARYLSPSSSPSSNPMT